MTKDSVCQGTRNAHRKEIVISKDDAFPIPVKILNNSNEVEKTYSLVRTKNDGFMLQK